MTTRLFGTDGVRGIANDDLSPELAFRLGEETVEALAGGPREDPAHEPGGNHERVPAPPAADRDEERPRIRLRQVRRVEDRPKRGFS